MPNILKQGSKHLSGKHAVEYRNIEACDALCKITMTSFGPNGMNKMVINRLEQLFVTSDASTIMKEIEVEHPAARILVMASEMQQREIGDGSNFVLVLAGELLKQALFLLEMGLHTSDVVRGYALAAETLLNDLEDLVLYEEKDLKNEDRLAIAIHPVIASKQYGLEDLLTPLVAKACALAMPSNPINFNVDNVRVCKLHGGAVDQCELIRGMVVPHDVQGDITRKSECRIAIFNESVDTPETETKGTVRLTNAQELMDYNLGEEKFIEQNIKRLADLKTDVIVTGGKFGEMAMHYIEKFGMMAVRVASKHELRRLASTVRGRMLVQFGAPVRADDLGYADEVYVKEYGLQKVTIFNQSKEKSSISTILLRSATVNSLNDIERAVDQGINVVKAMTKDARFVAGAGAAEIEMSRKIGTFGDTCTGLEQYAVKKFAESLEVFARTLGSNAGMDGTEIVSKLYAAHERGEKHCGVDIENLGIADMSGNLKIVDALATKVSGIKLAANAVTTILRIDQIIMSKPAGGPKAPKGQGHWDDDE